MSRAALIGRSGAGAAAALLFLGASPAGKDAGCPVVFTDVAAPPGSIHARPGRTPEHQLPETMGSGLAWLDFDNDGWMDLYAVQSGPFLSGSPRAQDRLYHNNGNGTFPT